MENFDFLGSFLFPYINWIVFLVLAYLLFKKPILTILAARRQSFNERVQKANEAKEEAERRHQELQARLAQLDQEIASLTSKGRAAADLEAQAIQSSAEQLAEHLRREARRIAEAEVAAAKVELQREILVQVKAHTIDQVEKSLDAGRHQKVVKQSLASLSQVPSEVRS